MNARDVLRALTRQGGPICRRRWLAVPNVYWGWGLSYEADLIAISKNGYCTEVEIKVSKQDLRADFEKAKWRPGMHDPRISRMYYAVTEPLQDLALELVPKEFGIIVAKAGRNETSPPNAFVVRVAKKRDGAQKVSDADIQTLQRLGVIRYWDIFLKESA